MASFVRKRESIWLFPTHRNITMEPRVRGDDELFE